MCANKTSLALKALPSFASLLQLLTIRIVLLTPKTCSCFLVAELREFYSRSDHCLVIYSFEEVVSTGFDCCWLLCLLVSIVATDVDRHSVVDESFRNVIQSSIFKKFPYTRVCRIFPVIV